MMRIAACCSTALVVAALGIVFYWLRPAPKSMPFPKGYLLQEKPSIFFNGQRDGFANEFLYDLVIEDIAEFVVVKNQTRFLRPDHPDNTVEYWRFTRAGSRAECLAADRSPQLRVRLRERRSSFDVIRGQCVVVQAVKENHSDLLMRKDDASWSFVMRSTGRRIARALKGPGQAHLRAFFGDRAGISRQPGSPVFRDDFTDAELVSAIETNGYATGAAIRIIRRRTRFDERGLVPEIAVRRAISPVVLESLLRLARTGPDPSDSHWPGFRALIPGASAETAELIYSKMVEMLYTPFKASDPYGPWFYGTRWKVQIREKRPGLEEHFVRNDYVPYFGSSTVFRSASALALLLGQAYLRRFYEEFRTEIVNRTLSNTPPGFYTVILAHSESDLVGVISKIRARNMSPNRVATVWALIQQGKSLPEGFIEELRNGCRQDPDFLNNPRASKKFLGGETFCFHYFKAEGSQFGQ